MLGAERTLSHPGQRDGAGGRVCAGVRLGGDLDDAARALLQLKEGPAPLPEKQAGLAVKRCTELLQRVLCGGTARASREVSSVLAR